MTLAPLLVAALLAPEKTPKFSLTLIPQENFQAAQFDDQGNIIGNSAHYRFDRKSEKLTLVREIDYSEVPLSRLDRYGNYLFGCISGFVTNQRGEVVFSKDEPGVLGRWDMNSSGDIAGIRRRLSIPTVFVQRRNGQILDIISSTRVTLPASVVLNDKDLVAFTSEAVWERPAQTNEGKQVQAASLIAGFTMFDMRTGLETTVHTDDSRFWKLNRLDNANNVVGTVWEGFVGPRGFVSHWGNIKFLAAPNGSPNTYAADSNGEWVAGWSYIKNFPRAYEVRFNHADKAMLWTYNQTFNLQTLCPDIDKTWTLIAADAINNQGDIVGRVRIGNRYFAYVAKNNGLR